MDNEKIKQFVQTRIQAGDNNAKIAAFLKSKGINPTPEMFGQDTKIKTGMKGVGQVLGEAKALQSTDYQEYQKSETELGNMNLKLLQTIRQNKAQGKDTSRLEAQYKTNIGNNVDISDIAPSVNKTSKQLAGDLAQTAGYLATPLGASSVAGRVAFGTTEGAFSGLGSAMSQNKNAQGIVADTIKGASVGAVISGTFEAIGAGLRSLSKTNLLKNKTAGTYNKELQPSTKDLTKQIQNSPVGQAFKTIGVEIRDAVDDKGKPLYVGTYTTIQNKAKTTVENKGKELLTTLKKYDNVQINKNEVASTIISEMQDRMGRLNNNEIKTIKNEVNRMAEANFNPTKALEYKRMYDSKIPDSFWNDTADRTKAIAVQSRYILRDKLRTLINEKTGDESVKAINKAMGLAMDVRRLSASQIAKRMTEKIGATGQGAVSIFRAIQGLIDDTVFNPAITTRVAQGINRMGSKTGQTTARKLIRNAVIQKLSK